MPPNPPVDHWTLDKEVPVAIILTLFLQIVGFSWYAAKLNSRVEEQAARLARTEAQILVIDRDARDFGVRMARIEEKTGTMLGILERLERRFIPQRDVP